MKGDTVFCLVGDYAISENFIMANRVLIDAAAVAGVTLDGVDNAVFDFLDDANMISLTVLWAGAALVVPIEEDNHTGRRLCAVIHSQATLLAPLYAPHAIHIFWYDTGVNIPPFMAHQDTKQAQHSTRELRPSQIQ